jgi:hypothetical protein
MEIAGKTVEEFFNKCCIEMHLMKRRYYLMGLLIMTAMS